MSEPAHRKYKVAILAEPLDLQDAGIYVYVKNLVESLPVDEDIEYHIIRMKNTSPPSGFHTHFVKPYPFPGYQLLRKFIQLPVFLRKQAFDAVIEPAHFGPFGLRTGTSRVTIIHDLTPILFPRFHPFHSVVLHKILLKRIIRKADLVICNSGNTAKDLEQYAPGTIKKCRMVYPSIDKMFKPESDPAVFAKYRIKDPFFLSVGTLEPRKDHITIVRAFELFKITQRDSQHKLVLIGRPGWKSDPLFNYISHSEFRDDIHILHEVETLELPAFYTQCTAFIYASIYEGFGFPLMEAHNCGAACLAADNSSLSEIAQSFALFFPTGDAEALSALLAQSLILSNEKKKLPAQYNENFGRQIHEHLLSMLKGVS